MTPHFPSFSSPILILLLSFIVYKVDGTDQILSSHLHVDLKTLEPRDSCSPSVKGVSSNTNWTTLRVVHRHGPCSSFAGNRKQLSHAKVLDLDQAHVDDIHHRVSHSKLPAASDSTSTTTIPTRSGAYLGNGNYVVTVGFGTPKKDQTVIFDTGSSVTWIQCQPCAMSCYEQEAPLFDPSHSSTYANISCASSFCNELDQPRCSASDCIYSVRYGDDSVTAGFYAQDTLTLSPHDLIPRFRFGCGESNTGLFGGTDGLLGLGRGKPSIVSQTYTKYRGVFSYYLPLTSSSVGYLAFGSYPAGNLQLTPMLSNPNASAGISVPMLSDPNALTGISVRVQLLLVSPSNFANHETIIDSGTVITRLPAMLSNPHFYYLALTGISVGGQLLAVPPSIFANSGTIIDSGTVITRLPATAYSAFRSAFRQGMTAYKSVPGSTLLDTCYDFNGSGDKVTIPSVALHLDGGATIHLGALGVLLMVNSSQTCLAFAGNRDDISMSILGNTQQRGLNVLYDINKRVIGFGPGDCG